MIGSRLGRETSSVVLYVLFAGVVVAAVVATATMLFRGEPEAQLNLTHQQGVAIGISASKALKLRFEHIKVRTEGERLIITTPLQPGRRPVRPGPPTAEPDVLLPSYVDSPEKLERFIRSRSARVLKAVAGQPEALGAKGIVVETWHRVGIRSLLDDRPLGSESITIYAMHLPHDKAQGRDMSRQSVTAVLSLCEVRESKLADLHFEKTWTFMTQ